MLYYLFTQLLDGANPTDGGLANLFRYLTFRTGGALMTSLVIVWAAAPAFIRWLKSKQEFGQPIRELGPEGHILTKQGTPTMGGALILFAISISTLLWADLKNPFIWPILIVTIGYGLIGLQDDYLKVTKRHHDGLSGRKKLFLQSIIALIAWIMAEQATTPDLRYGLTVPLLKETVIHLHYFFAIVALGVVVGASNAVNLTDGLDGLAIVPVMINAAVFALIAYLVGNVKYADYLQLGYVKGTGEIAVFCGTIIGAGLGFLWYNAPPAQVFMGDTGSLALGGALGIIAIITEHELVLAITGGLFVVEAVSVMIQVYVYKTRKRRVFLMAPIHHHFEKKGWQEPTIVVRFWIISFVLALFGLATLKLR